MRIDWLAYGGVATLVLAGGMVWYRRTDDDVEDPSPVRGILPETAPVFDATPDFNDTVEAADYFREDLQFFRRKLDAFVGMANKHGDGRVLNEVDELLELIERASRQIQHRPGSYVAKFR